MRIEAQTLSHEVIQLELNLDNYIQGPVASLLCQSGDDRDPYEVFEDALPLGYTSLGDSALLKLLEQTCLYSVASVEPEIPPYIMPNHVALDERDLCLFKQRFFPNRGMSIIPVSEPFFSCLKF